jgi:hypothetical protein
MLILVLLCHVDVGWLFRFFIWDDQLNLKLAPSSMHKQVIVIERKHRSQLIVNATNTKHSSLCSKYVNTG